MDNRSPFISMFVPCNLSTVSINLATCSRTSSSSRILCCINCFNNVALRAGPLDSYMDSSFIHISREVSQLRICLSSDAFMARIKSDFALQSAAIHFFCSSSVTARASSSPVIWGLDFSPDTYDQVSFLIRRASTWIFHVS
jgi:hypothetical protein